MKDLLKVSISGVRGVVGQLFTPQLAATFAQAFGSFVGQGTVVVGRDTRPTGKMIERAVLAGLQSAGCKPLCIGVAPTPTLLIQVQELRARGGIIITASHNPSQWNALKFVDGNALFLSSARAEEMLDIYHQEDFCLVPESKMYAPSYMADAMHAHTKRVFQYVDVDAIRKCRFKVAADCCNGVGAIHTRAFLEALGCEVVQCFDAPTGDFERVPEPTPASLSTLCELVGSEACDVGFAQDPDGDRLAIVDEKGRAIGEDLTIAFAVRQVLDHHQQGPVVINLSTSKCVQCVAEARGCEVVRTKIGEINVSESMLRVGGVVGGEGNGGPIVPAIHPCRDSYAGMALVLEMMAMEKKSVSELRQDVPVYHMVKDKLEVRGERVSGILRALRRRYEDMPLNLLDGLHVEVGDAWFHARMSNTEPIIRVVAEAKTPEEARNLVDGIKGEIQELE